MLTRLVHLLASACAYVDMCMRAHDQVYIGSDPLELKLQVIVSFPMWVLGTEPESSAGMSALNC